MLFLRDIQYNSQDSSISDFVIGQDVAPNTRTDSTVASNQFFFISQVFFISKSFFVSTYVKNVVVKLRVSKLGLH